MIFFPTALEMSAGTDCRTIVIFEVLCKIFKEMLSAVFYGVILLLPGLVLSFYGIVSVFIYILAIFYNHLRDLQWDTFPWTP
uniref:Uncharacterized protein n=1 Tax=Anguilla anguilla TaxID=7936 RepID=A0A0E9XVH2_ANGAN